MGERLIIAGGGLSGTLTALAFAAARPDIHLTLLEGGPTLGGHHTWSFYETDLAGAAADLVAPMVCCSWSGYDVCFNGLSRTLSTGYRSVFSPRLHAVAMAVLGERVRLNTPVATLGADGVRLASGEGLSAEAVIDARGAGALAGTALRWQKFLGREIRLTRPHGLIRPIIMDARVPQIDGYRFVYVLPFTADTMLIEDTYYAEGPQVDADRIRTRIAEYAAGRGWIVAETLREEVGALPLILGGDFAALWAGAVATGGAVPIGLRAGLFHPVTGYSLPMAATTAVTLAAQAGPMSTPTMMAEARRIAGAHFARTAFDRLLNRMLFLAGRPQDRHRIHARFHTLRQPLIERFYAGRSRRLDRIRILVGKPPIPILRACRVVPERAALGPPPTSPTQGV